MCHQRMNDTDTKSDSEIDIEKIQNLAQTEGLCYAPINIDLSSTKHVQLPPLQWFNYNVPPKKMKITNTAFTAILSAKWMQERPYITSGPLTGNHVFSQLHFHWGQSNDEGSEHRAEGETFPLEMHVVHFNSVYGTQQVALTENDGLSVLIYFFKIQDDDNPHLEDLVESLSYIEIPHTSVHLELKPFSEFLRPFESDYFLYWGSVMTNTCSHCILWFISREPIGISARQMEKFRKLKGADNKPLRNNYREVQSLYNRTLFHVSPSNLLKSAILSIPTTPNPDIIKKGYFKQTHFQDAMELKATRGFENKRRNSPLNKLAVSFNDIRTVPSTEYQCAANTDFSDDEDVPHVLKHARQRIKNQNDISKDFINMETIYTNMNTVVNRTHILNGKEPSFAILNKATEKPSKLSNESEETEVHIATQVSSTDFIHNYACEDNLPHDTAFKVSKDITQTSTVENENLQENTSMDKGKSEWPQSIVESKHYQSPVNINPEEVPIAIFSPLLFKNYWAECVPLVMTNNGHTVEIIVRQNCPFSVLKGGPLSDEYEMAQLHFHWGPNDEQGCEHTLCGNRMAMEVHMVYYNKQFGSLDMAAQRYNGIAVVAFLMKAGNVENSLFQRLCCQLTRIEHPFTSVEINSDCLLWLEDHEQASGFYTFPGSLTMPIHSKNVIWIMYSSPINISHKQVDEFRHLQEGYHFIKQNYRELQPFDDRPIYYYP